ncbi:DUF202 domain-containing protein [Mycobacterium lacus]|uniref:Uncharacterized protein n=1 Tax=Mycobacterium lacus TaxID=169765 RepID=A0A1X1XUX0_9MYCO|nr:DUF202 domain-containing protein [Mycobacterium lacus]MCV7122166.1 DUF202 domain-containing protein [Mycobacterium lacus]ORW02626.1 hypothetical protein AWC15_06445 [Mycobacterium lacus]BBX97001.1 hypothetical protein MLAC_22950 [Mycobacterium lacus]
MTGSTATGDRRYRETQAARTALAWTRTSFAFLANGALLSVKYLHGREMPARLIPALLAAAVALGTYIIAVRRQRTLQQEQTPTRITPRRQVYVIGLAVVVLVLVTMVSQVI